MATHLGYIVDGVPGNGVVVGAGGNTLEDGGAPGGGHVIRHNGSDLAQRTYLNFVDDGSVAVLTDDEVNDQTIIPLATVFPKTSILDDFNRVDEGPPPSANWTDLGDGLQVVSNRARGNAVGSVSYSYWSAAQFGPNCEAYCTVYPGTGATAGDVVGLAVRVNLETGDIYWLEIYYHDTPGDLLQLRDKNGTLLGRYVIPALAPGDSFGLRAVNDVLLGFYRPFNGVWQEVIRVVNSVSPAATGHLLVYTSRSADDIWEVDDFGGGTL